MELIDDDGTTKWYAVRDIVVKDHLEEHHVYWAEYHGTRFDGEVYKGCQLMCSCDFDYEIIDGARHNRRSGHGCHYQQAARRLRCLQLKEELKKKHREAGDVWGGEMYGTADDFNEVYQLYLEGVWIGQRTGSTLYIQEIGDVFDVGMPQVWRVGAECQEKGYFSLNFAIVEPWHEKELPTYKEWKTYQGEYGSCAVAQIPDNMDYGHAKVYFWKDQDKTQQMYSFPHPLDIQMMGEMGGGWERGWEEKIDLTVARHLKSYGERWRNANPQPA